MPIQKILIGISASKHKPGAWDVEFDGCPCGTFTGTFEEAKQAAAERAQMFMNTANMIESIAGIALFGNHNGTGPSNEKPNMGFGLSPNVPGSKEIN